MNGFRERWAACARLARTALEDETAAPPEWSAIRRRQLELERAKDREDESVEWWGWYGVRGVAVASVMVLVCLVFASRGPSEGHPLRPGVEEAVAEAFWLL